MAETNEKIVEDLINDSDITKYKTEPEHDDNIEFQDALGPPEDNSPEYMSSDESDYDTVSRSKEPKFTKDDIEERKAKVLDIKEKGNEHFRCGNHDEACQLYSEALKICPTILTEERSMLYNNRAAAKTKKGENERALKDCTKAIELNPTYFKALLRRAKLYEELDQLDKALADYKELQKLEPNNREVNFALMNLPKRIEEQTEKLKQEMFGKMKDLGNMFLKPFGLSTDNFKINQDPSTGSYSVNMTK